MRRFSIGVDIGQAQDYSSIAINELIMARRRDILGPDPNRSEMQDDRIIEVYKLVELKTLPLGADYVKLVKTVKAMMNDPRLIGDCDVVMDTGQVGRAVRDLFLAQDIKPICITITSGQEVGKNDIGLTVPKMELVRTAEVMLNTRRVKFAKIAEINEFLQELTNFKLKINERTKHISAEAATNKQHDDRVMAYCLSLWWLVRNSSIIQTDLNKKRGQTGDIYDTLRYNESYE